jgi:hypothetical protein
LFEAFHGGEDDRDVSEVPESELPDLQGKIRAFPSAVAMYWAPSDLSGTSGMLKERIRSVYSWRGGQARHDCVFIAKDTTPGFSGLHVARVRLFFSFKHNGVEHEVALVHWYEPIGHEPCQLTRMWRVEPDVDANQDPLVGVVHIGTILRAAHLIPIYGDQHIPTTVNFENSLELFKAFYVNKFADHHSHEIAF